MSVITYISVFFISGNFRRDELMNANVNALADGEITIGKICAKSYGICVYTDVIPYETYPGVFI
jgi:hypothetical protein